MKKHKHSDLLHLLPEHRALSKRGMQLTLDDLIDDYRKASRLSASDFDLIMMSYRLEHVFLKFFEEFSQKKVKPRGLADLWRLAFASIMSRDQSHPAQIANSCVEAAKEIFGTYCASPTNAFCRKLAREKDAILAQLDEHPEVLLGESLQKRWKDYPELIHRFSENLFIRPESGVSYMNDQGDFLRGPLSEVTQPSQILSEASFSWIQHCVEFCKKKFVIEKKNAQKLNVLDACAAPGGKIISFLVLAEKIELSLNNVVACDAKFKRLERLKENLGKWEMNAVQSVLYTWASSDKKPEAVAQKFDIIFADLPCTGLGTVLSRPDLLSKNWSSDKDADKENIFELQKNILNSLKEHLNKDGTLFVSICSSDPFEINSISKILGAQPDFHTQVSPKNPEEITGWVI